jgi:hypothetical protein
VADDVAAGAVSPEAAETIYGVVCRDGLDEAATQSRRAALRRDRIGDGAPAPERMFQGAPSIWLSDTLFLGQDRRGWHVVSKAGYILCSGSTRWRAGAIAKTGTALPAEYMIRLHDDLAATTYYCPASGALLSVDVHRRDEMPKDDVVLEIVA